MEYGPRLLKLGLKKSEIKLDIGAAKWDYVL